MRFRRSLTRIVLFSACTSWAAARDGAGAPSSDPVANVDKDSSAAAPPVADLIAALQRTEAMVESLQTECVCLSKHNFVKPGEKLPEDMLIEGEAVAMVRRATVSWAMHQDGRARMESALQRTNIRHDGSEILDEEETLATYDGKAGQFFQTHTLANGAIVREGRSIPGLRRTHETPFDLTVYHQRDPISKILTDGKAKLLRNDAFEERPIAVVECEPVAVREDYILRRQFWIDAERGVVVRRESQVQCGPGKPWGLHLRIDGTKYAEAAPGVWLPGAVVQWNYVVTEAGQGHLAHYNKYAFAAWKVNQPIEPSQFTSDLPLGTTVLQAGVELPLEPTPVR